MQLFLFAKLSLEVLSVETPGGYRSQGCHGYIHCLLMAPLLPHTHRLAMCLTVRLSNRVGSSITLLSRLNTLLVFLIPWWKTKANFTESDDVNKSLVLFLFKLPWTVFHSHQDLITFDYWWAVFSQTRNLKSEKSLKVTCLSSHSCKSVQNQANAFQILLWLCHICLKWKRDCQNRTRTELITKHEDKMNIVIGLFFHFYKMYF